MELVRDGALALLAALGLATLFYLAYRAVFDGESRAGFTALVDDADPETLEQTVRSLRRGGAGRVVLLLRGDAAEETENIARLLCRDGRAELRRAPPGERAAEEKPSGEAPARDPQGPARTPGEEMGNGHGRRSHGNRDHRGGGVSE